MYFVRSIFYIYEIDTFVCVIYNIHTPEPPAAPFCATLPPPFLVFCPPPPPPPVFAVPASGKTFTDADVKYPPDPPPPAPPKARISANAEFEPPPPRSPQLC